MKFYDAAYYGSVATFNSVMAQGGADDFAYYIGGNIALHAWNGADVIALRTGNRRGMAIHVTTVAGRDGAADGAYFARYNRNTYGARTGDRMCLDLEPDVFRRDSAAALSYGIAWSRAVRAEGFSPVLYCTPDGCALIADKGFDAPWAAVPDNCDPSSIFSPNFFPDNVAVQCGQNTVDGVNFDINISQFLFSTLALGVADMAAALRPDGSLIDYFAVGPSGSLQHYIWSFADGMKFVDDRGGSLVPNSISAVWVGVELVVFGQAPDGSIWNLIWDGSNWGAWTNTGAVGKLPPSGVAGPPVFIPHTHKFIETEASDSGTPTV